MPNPLPVGTRIRFTKTLTEDATGDHPAFIYAERGTCGTITGDRTARGAEGKDGAYWVTWDHWKKAPFGASEDEFEVIPNA